MPVTTQTEFLDHINTSELVDGEYKLKIELTYDGQSFPAQTEKVFYVGLIKGVLRGVLKNTTVKLLLICAVASILFISVFRRVTRTLIT